MSACSLPHLCYSECALKKNVEFEAVQKSEYFQYVINKFLKLPEQKSVTYVLTDRMTEKNILAKVDFLLERGGAGRKVANCERLLSRLPRRK